jgi:SAM-dependent methyltransferase
MDPYADDEHAALYDLFFGDEADDLAMYESFARRGDTPVLELGVGTGRVALHLARAGLNVVGIDSSPAMLRRLLRRAAAEPEVSARIRAVEADMRAFKLDERFDLVFCAVNSFQHLLTADDQIAALRSVAAHLTKDGVFVAKMRTPAYIDWNEDGALHVWGSRIDPATKETITRMQARVALPACLQTRVTQLYDRVGIDGTLRRSLFEFTLKYTTPDELRLLLAAAGLRLHHLYADHNLSPFDATSDSMIFVAGLEG